jgi:hypothetical protein
MLEPGQTLVLLKLEFITSTFAPALRADGDLCPAR